jgi:formamidopyrimidine-DNA glycosylase
VFAGIGNIYRDEFCTAQSRIPLLRARTLQNRLWRRACRAALKCSATPLAGVAGAVKRSSNNTRARKLLPAATQRLIERHVILQFCRPRLLEGKLGGEILLLCC